MPFHINIGQIREDQPEQANMSPQTPNNSKLKGDLKARAKEPGNNCFLSLSPGNHESSADQPLNFLPSSDQEHHGKGEAGNNPLLQ